MSILDMKYKRINYYRDLLQLLNLYNVLFQIKLTMISSFPHQQNNLFIDLSSPSTESLSFFDSQPQFLSLYNTKDKKTFQSIPFLHSLFHSLKRELKIKDCRKTHIDSLLKKVKAKCLKAIHEVLKSCVNLIVGRLPQLFITNIKIDYNKCYLNKTVGDIYQEFKLLPSYDDIKEKHLIRKDKDNLLKEILNNQLKDVYKIYLESELFQKDFDKIKQKDGEKMLTLYNFVARNMSQYFLLSKGNKNTKSIRSRKNKSTLFNVI